MNLGDHNENPVEIHIQERSPEWKLAFLRIQLYSAAQSLKGEYLDQFWELIEEVQQTKELHKNG